MRYYEVAPAQIIRSDSSVFTYATDQELTPGHIVTIEVGSKIYVGLVMRETSKPDYRTKKIHGIIEPVPIPEQLVRLAEWIARYYGSHQATVLQTILPRGLQKKRRVNSIEKRTVIRSRTKFVFNKDQRDALRKIEETPSGSILLHGVTGSGKTAVYIEAAKQTLARGRSAIILVPEIALTSQLVDEFSMYFDNIILTHSRQTEAQRNLAWREALVATEPFVIIGPRSALFMPVKDIGLIVIDEAHEPSFKQEQSPRYSALRAASILATSSNAKLILGSATPSISDYFIAKTTNRPIVTMTSTARQSTPPSVTLVDMTKRQNFRRHRFLSDTLLQKLEQTFASGGQALIFHNRRGSASTTLCENCGWSAGCPRCFLPLTLHADLHKLRCHVCGLTANVPTGCPVCHSAAIIHKGIGTKLIESELKKIFPDKRIGRFDGDSEAGESVEARYKDIYDGNITIIVGTQVIAKGLDLPNLRAVGVVQADAGLALPDYAAAERTFQLLAQVVGRVGRSRHETAVVIQSYRPEHYAVTNGYRQNYDQFYKKELAERHRSFFPPFCFLLKLTCAYKTEAAAVRNSRELATILRGKAPGSVEILGPTPSFYERQRDSFRWQLILKSRSRAELSALLQYIPSTHWQFELDPTSLL